jgi:hypothetical protein
MGWGRGGGSDILLQDMRAIAEAGSIMIEFHPLVKTCALYLASPLALSLFPISDRGSALLGIIGKGALAMGMETKGGAGPVGRE